MAEIRVLAQSPSELKPRVIAEVQAEAAATVAETNVDVVAEAQAEHPMGSGKRMFVVELSSHTPRRTAGQPPTPKALRR